MAFYRHLSWLLNLALLVLILVDSSTAQPSKSTPEDTSVAATRNQESNEIKELNETVKKLYQAGKYAEALALAQRALELSDNTLGPEHPDAAIYLNNLAELYNTIGDYAKAEPGIAVLRN